MPSPPPQPSCVLPSPPLPTLTADNSTTLNPYLYVLSNYLEPRSASWRRLSIRVNGLDYQPPPAPPTAAPAPWDSLLVLTEAGAGLSIVASGGFSAG